MSALASALVAAVILGAAAACDADDPFALEFVRNIDTTTVFSLARPDLNLPSGFDFEQRQTVRIHTPGATDRWDFAVDTREGQLVLLPPGALGIENTSGITVLEGRDLEEVSEAPADSALYTFDAPVPLREGAVYVVRTREVMDRFGIPCVKFAKLGPVDIRVDEGVLTFAFDANPRCDDPTLQGDEAD